MTESIAEWLKSLTADLQRVVRRFMLPSLAAFLLTSFHVFELDTLVSSDKSVALRISVGLSCFFFLTLTASLYAQSRKFSIKTEIAMGLAAGLVIILLMLLWRNIYLTLWPLAAGCLLLVAVAPYVKKERDEAAFWLFNHNCWIAAAVGFIGAILFCGGISAILSTLKYLFGIPIAAKVYYKVWIVGMCFISPMVWLSLMPEEFDRRVTEGPQVEFTSIAVDVLTKYILVPLLIVYAVILHVYAAKIAIVLDLPKGQLGWLVLTYGGMVTVTALLAFPTRESSGMHVALFWRYWPFLLIVPIILLFVAIGVRISTYGWTMDRYIVVLAGVWLIVLVASQSLQSWRDLRLIPAALAGLLLLASFGPWSMSGYPLRSQISTLETALVRAGVIKDGKVVIANGKEADFGKDARRVHGALNYLRGQGRLDVLRPMFEGVEPNPFVTVKAKSGSGSYKLAKAIKKRMGVGREGSSSGFRYSTFGGRQPYFLPGPGRNTEGLGVFGPLWLSNTSGKKAHKIGGGREVRLSVKDNKIVIIFKPGSTFTLDILADKRILNGLESGRSKNQKQPRTLRLVTNTDGRELVLHLISLSVRSWDGGPQTLQSARVWLEIPSPK